MSTPNSQAGYHWPRTFPLHKPLPTGGRQRCYRAVERGALRLLLALLCWLIACSLTRSTPPAVAAAVTVRTLRIAAPAQIKAGVPLTVMVHVTPAAAASAVLLTAQGTFGFLPQQQRPVNGIARFSFPIVHTRFAGTVELRASADQVAAGAALEIVPGPAVDPLLPLVGPRSIVTGGEHWTMAVTTPRDALDNPVAEHTLVTFRVQHPPAPDQAPATGLETMEAYTQHLLAWARIYSGNYAGAMLIAANADFGHSPERTVMETPGLPVPFQLQVDKRRVPADGRQLVRLTSSQITDRFGNVLLDGVNVTVLADIPGQDRRSLPATTIDGRIYTTIQAPSQPGAMRVQAWIAGVASAPLQIEFTPGPAVQPILVVTQRAAAGLILRAGPLLGQLGQFVPDGIAVTFIITAPDGSVETVVAPADYGYAQILLRQLTLLAGAYQVTVTAGTGQGAVTFVAPAADAMAAPAVGH